MWAQIVVVLVAVCLVELGLVVVVVVYQFEVPRRVLLLLRFEEFHFVAGLALLAGLLTLLAR